MMLNDNRTINRKMFQLWSKRFDMEREGKDTAEISCEIFNIEYWLWEAILK